jgi:hypothetical protein
MKTAEEKASALLNKLNIRGKLYDNIKPELIIALKIQDRDTRHACAEAVLQIKGEWYDNQIRNDAHDACMNVRAV